MTFVATIRVLPKSGVRDPQGEAVRGALRSLGLAVSDVRTGKEIVVTFEAPDETAARDAVRVMGTELLANPPIEHHAHQLNAAPPARPPPPPPPTPAPPATPTSSTRPRSRPPPRATSSGTRTP